MLLKKLKRVSKHDQKPIAREFKDDIEDSSKETALDKRNAKRSEAAEKAGLDLCDCGGLIWDFGDFRKCGDCGTKY